ncbi:HAD superfamily hydrolase (TIGR01509 family)/HAD superfamily hydrolase (TIGR01549 family) [Paenibacillus sp. BK033]|uniref:HAD family hydrolase n=1 Tax=Paenibacillus sp. BK033 TaxID=2512133 RepID=UPI0010EE9F1E|nr:HAD family phosphatase [Paenibacillus sp. BK033]TCM85425.1 HAD superfamily hydrolase (TIGR01509 family)/HAD superfamily hydrolase (TIGR01549 family) [Paenibacillus sp. BK033]TCM99435.1 HAD superfamily hydrolase (TIGR01509 family)/HAD superfamily hydrolase (TIGR01549 family) [Paenibacillus sp. BK033]
MKTKMCEVLFDQGLTDKKVIGAFIFDMDGVILDSEPLHFEADRLTMAQFGHHVEQEDLESFVGMTNPEMWRVIRQTYGIEAGLREILAFQKNIKLERLLSETWEPIQGIKDLLVLLQAARIPMAVASSSPRWFIEGVLTRLSIENFFKITISGEEMKQGKPSPDIYLEAARLLGVRPEHCVVLEDSRNGVVAAKAAGMTCIGFINLNSGQQDLTLADYTVSEIMEISSALR